MVQPCMYYCPIGHYRCESRVVQNLLLLYHYSVHSSPATSKNNRDSNAIASSSVKLSWFNNDANFLTSATGLTSYDAFTHPQAGKSATTTELQITGGLLSTASTTIASNLNLSSLSQGFLYTGSNGPVQPTASSSIRLSWFNNDANFSNLLS